ncbi:MAG: sigma-54-dependent Fis family transcriptional regulator [Deltaproteobacteria bacterium]|nr:sigma-54-dependent Fis family transcriptional regulator [Deltaproteobacteria bacterium]MBI3389920.1 sigma-54-dependent Fis family transcriptional regulator [Deltaproteobacteria bacterium]
MRVLVVEDDAATRAVIEKILRARGHEVTAFADAESAWAVYQGDTYPLVLMDWLLPGMDGLQLCRQMRATPFGDHSIIVVCTTRDQPDDLHAVLAAGADDYLTKPVDVRRLNVRLSIAERQVENLSERKRAEAQITAVLAQLEHSRDDLLSILNALRVGSAIAERDGSLSFLSESARRLLADGDAGNLALPWERSLPFSAHDAAELRAMAARAPAHRTKVPVCIETGARRRCFLDVEVVDDPRDPQRKIFFLYDVSEVHDLRRLLDEKAQFRDLVGKSTPMVQMYQLIRDLARVDSTVLIEGETGTGKELVARAIHYSSHRAEKPFIAVNSAGLTDSLLASQLFGHKRGAFTGAFEDHKGVFEAAEGGTIFLDEIGDVPLNVQTSLLRVLQEREITRLGESKPRKVDVRVLAATHHNLSAEAAAGDFRPDLLYRIRVARVHPPSLRERREDIPLLVGSFLGQVGAATGKPVEQVSAAAMHELMQYAWPGNVRELRSAIEFAVIRCQTSVIDVTDLPPELTQPPVPQIAAAGFGVIPEIDERERLLTAIQSAKGNRTEAARLLGISRATLYRRLSELQVDPK